jgi:hypothetical protein
MRCKLSGALISSADAVGREYRVIGISKSNWEYCMTSFNMFRLVSSIVTAARRHAGALAEQAWQLLEKTQVQIQG